MDTTADGALANASGMIDLVQNQAVNAGRIFFFCKMADWIKVFVSATELQVSKKASCSDDCFHSFVFI